MAERQMVECEKCGKQFERSVFHPYIVHCPKCRKTEKPKKTKGSTSAGGKLARVDVVCEKCGATFDRSIAHPYLVTCPVCRGTKKKVKTIGCKFCRDILYNGDPKPGMYHCQFDPCGEQYWIYGDGWFRTWIGGRIGPSQLWFKDKFVSALEEGSNVREIMNAYQVG